MNTCECGGLLAPTDISHPADSFCVRCGATFINGRRVMLSRREVAAGANDAVRRARQAMEDY